MRHTIPLNVTIMVLAGLVRLSSLTRSERQPGKVDLQHARSTAMKTPTRP